MKFLITENQIERLVFRYLDNQDFIKIETDEVIYFVYSESDVFAQISYLKNIKGCFIYLRLINEISNMFSLEKVGSKEIIGEWVENTLKMRVVTTTVHTTRWSSSLRIPSK